MRMVLSSWFKAAALAGALAVAGATPGAAQSAENKQPSDRTVDFLKTFVEGFLIPEEIPVSDGTKIKVNRSDKEQMKKFEIPRDDMRRIIRIAYNGANAEICNRLDLQKQAYKWVQEQETKKNKWSKHQMFFISRLYVATVMWQTGKAQIVVEENEPKKTKDAPGVPEFERKNTKPVVCTDAKKEGVKRLEAFLKAQSKS